MARLLGFVTIVALVGCGPGAAVPATKAPDVEVPAVEAAPDPVLVLGEAKIFDPGKPEQAVMIAEDGTLSLGGQPIGSVTGDGELRNRDGGAIASVDRDGVVTVGGEPTGLVLAGEGGAMEGGVSFVFAGDGSVAVEPADPGAPAMGHEGCAGAMAKTCGLVLFGILTPVAVETTPPG